MRFYSDVTYKRLWKLQKNALETISSLCIIWCFWECGFQPGVSAFFLVDRWQSNVLKPLLTFFCQHCFRLLLFPKFQNFLSLEIPVQKIFIMEENIWTATTEMYIRTCAYSEDSDQPAHSRRLIWIFTGRIWIARDAKLLHADNEDSDQTVRMCRLIESPYGGHIKGYVFSRCGSFDKETDSDKARLSIYKGTICVQRRPRSACAFAQSDQGLCCLQTESLEIVEYIGFDRSTWMRRLMMAVAVRMWHTTLFLRLSINCNYLGSLVKKPINGKLDLWGFIND